MSKITPSNHNKRIRLFFKGMVKIFIPIIIRKKIYMALALRYINRNIDKKIDKNKKTIIILDHFFSQDVKALILSNTNYNLISIDTPYVFRGAKLFFRADVKDLNAPYDSEDQVNRAAYKKECQIIFNALRNKFGIDLIVTASDNYYWVRELIEVARDNKIKTIVLDKEGLISPFDFDALVTRTLKNAPFISDHIFVWSERQKEFWNKIGVVKDKISVIGQPRSDLFHYKIDKEVDKYFNKSRPLITFFTYSDDAYIPFDSSIGEEFTWEEMKKQTQDFLYDLAVKHPEYNFVFKAHPQQLDLEKLQMRYKLNNLRVIGGANIANELVARSELIIAFQTTAVLEAMFMNKRVIYTGWDPTEELLKDHLLPFREAPGIVVARTFNTFRKVCERFFSGDINDFQFSNNEEAQKHVMVSKYLYKPDGYVCDRFFKEIDKII